MRAQSQEHVSACESATSPASQCRCRCKGKCHGRRLVADGAGREAFEALPAEDPHRLPTAAEQQQARCEAGRDRRRRKRQAQLANDRRAFIERVRGRNPERAAELEAQWFPSVAC